MLESEVKFQVRVDERGDETPTGSIHVDPHIPSVLLVQLLCSRHASMSFHSLGMVLWKLTSHPESPASYTPAGNQFTIIQQMSLKLPSQHSRQCMFL